MPTTSTTVPPISKSGRSSKKPFYATLWVQVVFAIALAVIFGHFRPNAAVAMKPLGDAFIRLITMIITVIIFCTVVSGIAGMQDMKKVGRVGGKAILYFEMVSTIALALGLVVLCVRMDYAFDQKSNAPVIAVPRHHLYTVIGCYSLRPRLQNLYAPFTMAKNG